jgi:hypothetical protein
MNGGRESGLGGWGRFFALATWAGVARATARYQMPPYPQRIDWKLPQNLTATKKETRELPSNVLCPAQSLIFLLADQLGAR